MPDLRIKDLTVEFSNSGFTIRPLDNFSLEIPSGSLALLLGPSGCGKTTLLSCLGSILTPTSGSITFGDVEIAGLKGQELTEYRRNTIGIVFQAFNLVESLSAVENVALPLRAAGYDWKHCRRGRSNCSSSSGSVSDCTTVRADSPVVNSNGWRWRVRWPSTRL